MQVEVSKHTEGSKEKTVRPNGLPESLIRYDGTFFFSFLRNFQIYIFFFMHTFNKTSDSAMLAVRQKEMASNSVNELLEEIKNPRRARALSESTNNRPTFMRKSEGDQVEQDKQDTHKLNLVNKAPARRHSHAGTRTTTMKMEKINEVPEKKPKKSARLSFMG